MQKQLREEKPNQSIRLAASLLLLATLVACNADNKESFSEDKTQGNKTHAKNTQPIKAHQDLNKQDLGKPVIYQVFTRIFGNRNTNNKPWGTVEENGVGKFNDFTVEALKSIKAYGTTHIWYTGVPHHALVADYTAYGISNDDPDVIKGRAGSPYAVKDYYNVNPDLAIDPAKRLEEFKSLIDRTHQQGMKVIIDIVPNHIARNYQSLSKPKGVDDFGANDDTSVKYARDNNFYYVVSEDFKVPEPLNGYKPLGGEKHPLVDSQFNESPAKWTGNGSRKSQPHFHDWYETVKVNYGVKPDGSYDFDRLPVELAGADFSQHAKFWSDKAVPDSWVKFKDIVLYWTEFGVDGFRYDMAEMVPVEFWSYLNSAIKTKNPNAYLLAEVYNPAIYRDFLQLGLMDSLYDKVDFYDTMKLVMQGKSNTSKLTPIVEKFKDIDAGLLHFLENHDEQRIASPDFAGNAEKGKPAMVVSSLIGKGATLLYFGQALGEAGEGDAGFGDPTRTTIFDYWGLEKLKRWQSDGAYSGSNLKAEERSLQQFYQTLLSFSAKSSAIAGHYQDLHQFNLDNTQHYSERLYAFARWSNEERVIVVSNFSDKKTDIIKLKIPKQIVKSWQTSKSQSVSNIFSPTTVHKLVITDSGYGEVSVSLDANESAVFVF